MRRRTGLGSRPIPRRGWPVRIVMSMVALCVTAPALSLAAETADPIFSGWRTYGPEQGLPSKKVMAVAVDGDRIWAGTEKGLALIEGGRVRTFGTTDGLPFPVITALAVDQESGDVWVGTMGGLARLSGGRIDAYTQMDSGLANNVIYGLAIDGSDVWVATAAGLNRYAPQADAWEIFDTTNTLMHEPWCYAVSIHEGTVYVAVWGGGVLVRDPRTGLFREHRDPDGEMEIDLFRDDGLVHDVTSGISYAGGVLWVGTYFGLSRYDGRHWRSYGETDSGLAGDFINFVRAWDDGVWIATDKGLGRYDSERWHAWRRREDDGRHELVETGPDGARRSRVLDDGPADNMIFGIEMNRDGVWLATASGLSHGRFRSPMTTTPSRTRPGPGGTR